MDVTVKERKPDVIGQRPDERALFEKILSHGLVDVARTLHPDADTMFTWWPPWRSMKQKNQGWRIDYVLASSGAHGLTPTECVVLADVGTSDHAPVVATFSGV
jgi:exodeoxyribonuclease-3